MSTKCDWSGKVDPRDGFPGDSSTCPLCYKWVKVKRDGNLASHAKNKRGRPKGEAGNHPPPKYTARMPTVKLTPDQLETLRTRATAENMSFAALVRMLLHFE